MVEDEAEPFQLPDEKYLLDDCSTTVVPVPFALAHRCPFQQSSDSSIEREGSDQGKLRRILHVHDVEEALGIKMFD